MFAVRLCKVRIESIVILMWTDVSPGKQHDSAIQVEKQTPTKNDKEDNKKRSRLTRCRSRRPEQLLVDYPQR